jgi:hypothetical protein
MSIVELIFEGFSMEKGGSRWSKQGRAARQSRQHCVGQESSSNERKKVVASTLG